MIAAGSRSLIRSPIFSPAAGMWGGSSFDPATLFAGGEAGAWYDPSDLSTVWQDSGRTTAGAVDSPVGAIDDKSGNGNNATQATAAARPVLRQTAGGKYYLEFDGVDDSLQTAAAVGLSAAPLQTAASLSLSSTAASRILLSNSRYYSLRNSGAGSAKAAFTTAGTLDYVSVEDVWTSADPIVLQAMFDSSFDVTFFKNGTALTKVAGTADSTTAEGVLKIGELAGGSFWLGRVYGLIVRKPEFTSAERSNVDSYLADKASVTL